MDNLDIFDDYDEGWGMDDIESEVFLCEGDDRPVVEMIMKDINRNRHAEFENDLSLLAELNNYNFRKL